MLRCTGLKCVFLKDIHCCKGVKIVDRAYLKLGPDIGDQRVVL